METEPTSYMQLRIRIEGFFERLGRWTYQNRAKTLIGVFLITAAVCSQLPKMQVDTSALGLIDKNDPIRLEYNKFIEQFGSDEIVIIAVKPPEIFDEGFLKKLKTFHNDLEAEVPYLKEINSLINARSTRGQGDRLIVDDLFSGWPEKPKDIDAIKDEVMNNPVFINNFISEDGQYTAVIVETEAPAPKSGVGDKNIKGDKRDRLFNGVKKNEAAAEQRFLSDKQVKEISRAVNHVKNRYQGPDFSIYVTGNPIVTDISNRISIQDAALLYFIDMLLICLLPLVLFRRFSGIIFPNLIMTSSVMASMGIMAVFKAPFTPVTITIPSFLIVVGVGDSIHILAIFYRNLNRGYNKEDAIAYALGHSGAAVLMTTITSAAGIMSFILSELAPFKDIGIFGPVGVFMAFFYTVIMLPALISFFPIKKKSTGLKQSAFIDRILLSFANFSIKNPVKIVTLSLLIGLISVFYVFQIKVSHFPLSWFPDNMAIKKDTELIDEKLRGTVPLEAIINTNKENGLYDPELLNAIETFCRETEKIKNSDIYVGKLISINDILKETNQALHGNNPLHYTIPQDRQTIAQELFLFEISGSDDLERFVDFSFSKCRITIKTKWADGIVYDKFIADTEKRLEYLFSGKADVAMTGTMALVARAFSAALTSMAKSYVACFSIICLMMILLVGNLRIGLVSMIPNLLPIVFVMGVIGFVGSPLDITTMMVCTIALGVIVDDTVHFIYNFNKYYDKMGDAVLAIQETFLGTGRAILVTSIILTSAYFAGLICVMKNIGRFGFYTALVIAVALIADFIVTPALMVLIKGNRKTYKTLLTL